MRILYAVLKAGNDESRVGPFQGSMIVALKAGSTRRALGLVRGEGSAACCRHACCNVGVCSAAAAASKLCSGSTTVSATSGGKVSAPVNPSRRRGARVSAGSCP